LAWKYDKGGEALVYELLFLAVWGCACMTGLLLIVNRSMDLLSPYYADVFFGGYKLLFWLIPPTLYGLFFLFFTKPFLFNSIMGALFLSPYAGIDEISVDIVDVRLFFRSSIQFSTQKNFF
jgi:hypothetical protein